jgi:tetratricopeptide (TPR) repeat protein
MMKKKISMALLTGLLIGVLVLTSNGTFAEEIGDSEVNLIGDKGPQIGEISGTITLTDVPSPAPKVNISVSGKISSKNWRSKSSQIKFSSDNYTDLLWSIPIYENDRFSPSNGRFTLHVWPVNNINSFSVDVPITPYISSTNTGGINLGTVSIKSITLSGTINLTHSGQPVQSVSIMAHTYNRIIGSTSLISPASTAPWSMMIPVISSDVTFEVIGTGNDKWHFSKNKILTVRIYGQDTSGISLNIGDMRTITLNGTIYVAYNWQQVPNVRIIAWAGSEYSGGSVMLYSPANGASWSITLEAPDSAKAVNFNISGYNKDEMLFVRQYLSSVSIHNQDKSGIVLNLGDMTDYGTKDYLRDISDYTRDKLGIVLNLVDMTDYGKKDYDRAIDDYTKAIQIDSKNANAYHNRGSAYYNKGDYDRAIDDYTKAIQIDSNNANAYHNRGFAYYKKRDYDRAIADYTQAIQINSNDAITYNNRGAAYNSKENYTLAIADFAQSIRLYPDFANPYRHRAFAYMKKDNYGQARADVNKALQINPNYQSAQELSAELQKLGY